MVSGVGCPAAVHRSVRAAGPRRLLLQGHRPSVKLLVRAAEPRPPRVRLLRSAPQPARPVPAHRGLPRRPRGDGRCRAAGAVPSRPRRPAGSGTGSVPVRPGGVGALPAVTDPEHGRHLAAEPLRPDLRPGGAVPPEDPAPRRARSSPRDESREHSAVFADHLFASPRPCFSGHDEPRFGGDGTRAPPSAGDSEILEIEHLVSHGVCSGSYCLDQKNSGFERKKH